MRIFYLFSPLFFGGITFLTENARRFLSVSFPLSVPMQAQLSDFFNHQLDAGNLYHNAIVQGTHDTVLQLIREGYDPNAKSSMRLTPLLVAIREGAMNTIHVLLQHGTDIHEVCHDLTFSGPLNAFLMAVSVRNRPMAEKLLELGAQINAIAEGNADNSCALSVAHKIDDLEIFRWLVSLGARSDDPDVFFQMIWKTESDSQFEMLRILFQQGHSPNITSHKGSIINEYTPLSWCLAGRGEDLDQKRFKFLLDHGADPSLRTQPDMPNTFEYAKKFPWALNILRARVFAELNT